MFEVHLSKQLGELMGGLDMCGPKPAGQGPDPFDRMEKLLAVLPDQGVAQLAAEAPDIGPQIGVGRLGRSRSVRWSRHVPGGVLTSISCA